MENNTFNSPVKLTNLYQCSDGDIDILIDLIETFIQEAGSSISKMEQAIADNDKTSLFKLTHNLKSSMKLFEADAASDLCHKLECIAREGLIKDSSEIMIKFKAEYYQIEAALNNTLNKLKSSL
ncbi:putative HPt domain-containing protein [Candidatus Magnetomoraceae bacterium gMMP-15]